MIANSPYPRIVRETFEVDYERYCALGATGMKTLQEETIAKALRIAKEQLGITRPHISTLWGLATYCDDTYPMYLCGPGAPRSDTPMAIFNNVWHLENPRARFQVVIRDRDVLDELDRLARAKPDNP
jgi:hypothetical protein